MRTLTLTALFILLTAVAPAAEQIHVGFHWHMHQPIYYPYENPIEVDAAGRFSFSVVDVHNQRYGPYTTWPYDAINAGSGLWHLGAQVSFSGSLIENLNTLEAAGVNGGMWNNWDWGYDQGVGMTTQLGNRRLEMVAFGHHHPLMPLLDQRDIQMQIRLHRHVYGQTWASPNYSRGMFPPETAFSTNIIPALVAEGVEWVFVDNIHFDRACQGYPHTNGSGLFAPNVADQINPNPADNGGAWVQLNDLWAPSQVSVSFGYQPHYVQHVDPDTGAITRIIAVPAARYEGNEDGRGGYGAFLYDQVMDQYLSYNTDAAHPMFVVLHHDGDNYGGGSDSYYHSNFQAMVNWVGGDPDYDVTTVEDYLDRFPPDINDVIHVEPGSWAGADSGDPEFKKWLGDPGPNGWSPDRNSWAVLTAAKNRVFTADDVAPATNMQGILTGSGSNTERAWRWLLCGQASCYWYWDGTEIWDSDVTRACNQAVIHADAVIAGQPDDTPPTIFLPQREPYNPGGYEWGTQTESSDFDVWTYAYDVSGLTSVTLKWRRDLDGVNPLASIQNEKYADGTEIEAWQSVAMTSDDISPPAGILTPTYRALRWTASIDGEENVLIDYYVEAVDGQGNIARSPIQHVYVGVGGGGGGEDPVTLDPEQPVAGEYLTINYDPAGRVLATSDRVWLHYGFNGWSPTIEPDPEMTWNEAGSVWQVTVPVQSTADQIDMVFHDQYNTWDNNNGADWHFDVTGGTPGEFVMDGQLDTGTTLVADNGDLQLHAAVIGTTLYVAAADAGEGNDHFIFIADTPGALTGAPWSKSGQVAGWSAYLATENDNGWSGWFDTNASTQSATGGGSGWLEGTIDLAVEFGTMPSVVYIAFAPYGNANGGALFPDTQVPPSINGDGNIDANEYAPFYLTPPTCPGDSNCDGAISWRDIDYFVAAMNDNTAAWEAMFAPGMPSCLFANNDINADGTVSWRDIDPLVALMNTTCP